MRLTDLRPRFLKRLTAHSFRQVETLAEADGLSFLCPKCWAENGGPVGTHSVICWSPSVAQDTAPTPGRWQMHGTGLDDLTHHHIVDLVPADARLLESALDGDTTEVGRGLGLEAAEQATDGGAGPRDDDGSGHDASCCDS